MRHYHTPICLLLLILWGCPAEGNKAPDMSTSNLDMDMIDEDLLEMPQDQMPNMPKARVGERCQIHSDCKRGLACADDFKCSSTVGCRDNGDPLPGYEKAGCLFVSPVTETYSAPECETNADCANSQYGDNCIVKVCHSQQPCTMDSDCPDGQTCYHQLICF